MTLPERPILPQTPPPLAGGVGGSGLPPVPPVGTGAPVPPEPGEPTEPVPGALPQQPTLPSAAPAAGHYTVVGSLSADQLLHGSPAQFDHLQDKIVEIRTWLQNHLTQTGRAEAIAEARQDPEARAAMAGELDRILIQYMSKESTVRGADRNVVMASIINEVLGLGPIEPLWSDARITEVMVNGPDTVFVEMDGKLTRAQGAKFRDRDQLAEVCQQILMPLNRRVDQKNPLTDGRLPDGSRVNIVHYAVAPHGPLLTIRRFPETVWTLKDLIENGSVTPDMATELAWLIYNKASAVIIGGTGSGKTSLLNALSSCIPRGDRVVTVEDSLELRLHPDAHVAAMEARPASASGEGQVLIRDLVKNALRMRPDRIVVGECRDAAALDMLQAMNTGHEGSMTTIHANGADEAVQRLEVMVAQGGDIPQEKVQWLIGDAVDIFVIQRRYEDGSRRIQGIYEVPSMRRSSNNRLEPIPLWEWEHTDVGPDGKFIGEYIKRNDISEEMMLARRLHQAPRLTVEDVYRMSELPPELRKGS
jgi:pilus assembly protein CpaF